ncbi:RNA polymerase sigma-70 factor [Bacteroides fragilis]
MKFIRKFPVADADSLESPQKFEDFFLDYYPRVKGFINGLLQDAEEAEDLSQDIFMSLWQNRGNLKQIDNLDAYLFRIARNAVFRYIERSLLFKNYQSRQLSDDNSDLYEIESELNAKELELIIAIAVERMPSQRRKIYQMSREQGLSNENIARELNISKRTVENHLTQALADIRKILFGSSWLLSYKLNKLYKKSVL